MQKLRVLLTGASAGFGSGVAKALAERGHTIYATMRDVEGKNAEKAAALKAWAKDGGHTVHVLELDVANDRSVQRAVGTAVELGGIDTLINNAGVGTWGIDEGFSVEQAKAIFESNVFGVMRLNHAVVPQLRAQGRGHILYVSSGLGRIVFPFLAIYGASKFALESYAESVSYELAPLGIRSTIVQPGAYGTTFLWNSQLPERDVTGEYGKTADIFRAFSSNFESRAKAGGLGDPSEVVHAIVEEVEATDADRPLRRAVGKDVEHGVTAINAASAQVQGFLASNFGFK
jgi:NAD(P)-dependent dehydrogenase (short-subunit alcohol dehydrogenase family)